MNTEIDDNQDNLENKTLAELLLESDLLAAMTRADGKILDVEKVVSDAYFEQQDSKKSELVKTHYDYVLNDENTDERLSTVMSFMTKLDEEDKYKLLRCLSAVAICDGDLAPKELELIKMFSKVMNIDSSKI